MRRTVLAAALLLALIVAPHGPAAAQEDAYLEGYAAAVLEQRFGIQDTDLRVRGGVLRLDPTVLPAGQRQEIIGALGAIEGLDVEVLGPARAVGEAEPATPERRVTLVSSAQGWLPRQSLFDPLIADPRWPRFSTSIQLYRGDAEVDTVFSANIGASIPLYGWRALGGQWQIGAQGGVFSIFDLESDSFDLINADYLFGLPLSYRYGPFSAFARFVHRSSHLGDEFVLRDRVERINLSYEAIDAILSYELLDAVRVYGGGGGIVRSDPDLDPLFAQAGLEITSPDPLIGNILYPIAAFDFQAAEELDWDQNYSVRAGLELRTEFLEERSLQLLLEYFNGRSPNGQFFNRDLEYYGVGLHFFF